MLLLAVLAAGLGAPLARSAPAAAATPRLPSPETARQAGQGLLFGQRLSTVTRDSQASGEDQLPGPPESAADEQLSTALTEGDDQTPRPPRTTPSQSRATARPGVPVIERSAVSRRRASRRESKIASTVSTQTERRATKLSDGFRRAKTAPSSGPGSEQRPGTLAESRAAPDRAGRSAGGDPEPAGERDSAPLDVEQEASGSYRVLTYHVQHTQHSRVAKSPRESPDFFVPPIRRRPSRRRVPLSAQTGSGRSLGAQLAQQVRRQLAKKQTRQQQQQLSDSSTTERPYQPPFVPTTPATTSRPYKHPFIPSSPTTTSKPYKHPFIPSPPTTTSKPYMHPFIPSPPTTTSQPFRHPFIPVPPESTRRPEQLQQQEREREQREQEQQQEQQHRQQEREKRVQELKQQQQQQQRREREQQAQREQEQQAQAQQTAEAPVEERPQERPQARRVSSGSVAGAPRLHLPRKPETTTAAPAASSTAVPAPAVPAAAKIVHQQTVEAGYIVGEYGELGQSGDTLRGVQYTAESSVDRSLLEAALRQFLEL